MTADERAEAAARELWDRLPQRTCDGEQHPRYFYLRGAKDGYLKGREDAAKVAEGMCNYRPRCQPEKRFEVLCMTCEVAAAILEGR